MTADLGVFFKPRLESSKSLIHTAGNSCVRWVDLSRVPFATGGQIGELFGLYLLLLNGEFDWQQIVGGLLY